MAARAAPELPSSILSVAERRALREAGLSKAQLASIPAGLVQSLTRLPQRRCEELCALMQFQSCTSVGPSLAADLYSLGFRRLPELKGKKPHALYERLCKRVGARVDPCVEDAFRAAIEQAEHAKLPAEKRNWWYWSALRKAEKKKS